MKQQFKIFKAGVTENPIVILSKTGEYFDFDFKVKKYKFLGYTVTDLQNNII